MTSSWRQLQAGWPTLTIKLFVLRFSPSLFGGILPPAARECAQHGEAGLVRLRLLGGGLSIELKWK